MTSTKKAEDIPVAIVVKDESKTVLNPTSIVTMIPKPPNAVQHNIIVRLKRLIIRPSIGFDMYRYYINKVFGPILKKGNYSDAIDAPLIVALDCLQVEEAYLNLRTLCIETFLYWEVHLSAILSTIKYEILNS